MESVFTKIVERLEERRKAHFRNYKEWGDGEDYRLSLEDEWAIENVNQVAEEYKSLTIEEKSLTEKFNDGWIPISSGNLPDEYTRVLACNNDGDTMIGYVHWDEEEEDFHCASYGAWMGQVVAWMPIVPYKEGE